MNEFSNPIATPWPPQARCEISAATLGRSSAFPALKTAAMAII